MLTAVSSNTLNFVLEIILLRSKISKFLKTVVFNNNFNNLVFQFDCCQIETKGNPTCKLHCQFFGTASVTASSIYLPLKLYSSVY